MIGPAKTPQNLSPSTRARALIQIRRQGRTAVRPDAVARVVIHSTLNAPRLAPAKPTRRERHCEARWRRGNPVLASYPPGLLRFARNDGERLAENPPRHCEARWRRGNPVLASWPAGLSASSAKDGAGA